MFSLRALLLTFVAPIALLACSDSSEVDPGAGTSGSGNGAAHEGGGGSAGAGSTTSTTSTTIPNCDGPLGPPRDPATLPACCPDFGGAHCVESVPDNLASYVGTCDSGGYCVPDIFIATGGVFTPPACTSLQGSAGVCLSACVPKVAEVANLLPQDICAESERCVPCISPIDNTDTGACKLGFTCEPGTGGAGGGEPPPPCDDPTTCVYDCPTPALDPAALPACPDACGGHCVDQALVPPDQQAQLASCGGGKLCVPDELIETNGKLVPPSCDSVAGFEGRCLSTCLPDVKAQAAQLPQSTCAAGHLCVPCYDPFDGTATGACTLSCDPGPQEPAQTLPACCGGDGTCVPSASVPPDDLANFGADTCPAASGLVCVPDQFLAGTYVPTLCTPSLLIQLFTGQDVGACMPACMPKVASAPFVDQGECASGQLCIPCFDDQGAPTGACETTAACAHDRCSMGAALTWGCDGAGCVTTVCQQDSYCCTTQWDAQCVDEATTACGCP